MIKILAACVGILAVSWLPTLPVLPQPVWLWAMAMSAVLILLCIHPRSRWLACLCLGALWAIVAGHQLLAQQLPAELAGEELLITGVIHDLPKDRSDAQRFEFSVEEYHNLAPAFVRRQLPKRLQLSWYGQQSLRVAQRWTLVVKLRRPRGFVNTGGFDYQRWLLSQGLGATGYVRASTHNQLHGFATPSLRKNSWWKNSWWQNSWLQHQRQVMRDWLAGAFDSPTGHLLPALAIGDTSAIAPAQWDLLRKTGTSHLMAISGLHIGLIALLGYWLGHGLRGALSLMRLPLSFGYWLPGIVSCALAALYSAMAGFALPTQRALTMVLLFNVALLTSRDGSSVRALAWAMLIVLAIDPLSGHGLGFWLSFGAVGILLFHFQHRRAAPKGEGRWSLRTLNRLRVFGRAQWAVSIGLLVPLFALNQPLSLLTPVANLVAIPLVSFLVVVPLLVGLVLNAAGAGLAIYLVQFAESMLGATLVFLEWLVEHLQVVAWYPQGAALSWVALAAAGAGILLLLSPRGLPARWLGVLLLAPLLLPRGGDRPPLTLTVLDVGQGLANVVSTENRVLVFDTGPAYSENFNAGDAIVAPYLRARGIQTIDRLIVSHGDGDHAGGVEALLATVTVDDLITGEPLPGLRTSHPALPVSPCDADRHWEWDGVSFALIEPAGLTGTKSNDQSCILLITHGDQRILIPGDMEALVENVLLAQGQAPEAVSVLIAPHHGSATSSTQAFVVRSRPQHVVYSTAFNSRYGHPHPAVQARYRAVGSQPHDTGHAGQLTFIWDREGKLRIEPLRQVKRRYWYD